jgi:hypothetical protein
MFNTLLSYILYIYYIYVYYIIYSSYMCEELDGPAVRARRAIAEAKQRSQ